MNVAITGGGGFLGRRVALALLADPGVGRLTLADLYPIAPFCADPRLQTRVADLSQPGSAGDLVEEADVIFHLAAVVSGQAEADFDIGMKVNIDATRVLLDAARATGRCPRFVFTSSLAVFGPPVPAVVSDETPVYPQSSYGAQKAVGELLVGDYTRKGFIDGRAIRLPTVCVRPGKPNAAASSFVSGIIREPLQGEEAMCPVAREQELWLSSPRAAVANLLQGARIKSESIGARRTINAPGITVTVGEMLDGLERVGGAATRARVSFGENPAVRHIVSSWPARFDVGRALSLGFIRDIAFEGLVREFVAEQEARKTLREP